MKDVKRSVKGQRQMGKSSIPGKVRVHPHTAKALNAVAVKKVIHNKSGADTNNGLDGADNRY